MWVLMLTIELVPETLKSSGKLPSASSRRRLDASSPSTTRDTAHDHRMISPPSTSKLREPSKAKRIGGAIKAGRHTWRFWGAVAHAR